MCGCSCFTERNSPDADWNLNHSSTGKDENGQKYATLTEKMESIKLESRTCQQETWCACGNLCCSNRAAQCVLWLRWRTAYCCCCTIHQAFFIILPKGKRHANDLWRVNDMTIAGQHFFFCLLFSFPSSYVVSHYITLYSPYHFWCQLSLSLLSHLFLADSFFFQV